MRVVPLMPFFRWKMHYADPRALGTTRYVGLPSPENSCFSGRRGEGLATQNPPLNRHQDNRRPERAPAQDYPMCLPSLQATIEYQTELPFNALSSSRAIYCA